MYQLRVFYPCERFARATIPAPHGADVIEVLQTVLAEHRGCQHVTVFMGEARLFAVDRDGNRMP